MDLFFETAPVAKKARVHFHEFMLARHAFLRAARARGDIEANQLIAQAAKEVANDARLLCFDEFAVTDIADAMILGRLFERLFALDVVVVATSNRRPALLPCRRARRSCGQDSRIRRLVPHESAQRSRTSRGRWRAIRPGVRSARHHWRRALNCVPRSAT